MYSSPKKSLQIAVLASGSGTNFQAILDAITQGTLHAQVSVLLSNNPQALAIERAKKAQIPVVILDHRDFADRDFYDDALCHALKPYPIDLLVLAGFMRILGKKVLDVYRNRVINIHPALLPAFPGLHAIEKAFDSGGKVTGVTVHLVDDGVDSGPILAQQDVPILESDTKQILEKRIHEVEHQLYPKVIEWFAKGKVEISGRVVKIRHEKSHS